MASDSAPSGVARFLSVADAAEIFDIDVSAIMELVDSAELPAIRLGDQWRIERSELEAFIESRYEEQRRRALWLGSDFAGIAELAR